MMIVISWVWVWHCVRSCMMIMSIALVMGRIKQVCHYGSQITKSITERYVSLVTTSDSQGIT